jgi:hypothetical protein
MRTLILGLGLSVLALLDFSRWRPSHAYEACGLVPPMPERVWVHPNASWPPSLTTADVTAGLQAAWQSWSDLPDSDITYVMATDEEDVCESRNSYLEREMGLEPATLCLGRLGFAIRI